MSSKIILDVSDEDKDSMDRMDYDDDSQNTTDGGHLSGSNSSSGGSNSDSDSNSSGGNSNSSSSPFANIYRSHDRSRNACPNGMGYPSAAIYRRARLLSYLSLFYCAFYAVLAVLAGPHLYAYFIGGALLNVAINAIAVRTHLSITIHTLLFNIVQLSLGAITTLLYYSPQTPELPQSDSKLIFEHLYLINTLTTLITTCISFSNYLMSGLLLLLLNVINICTNLMLYLWFHAPKERIVQNLVLAAITSVLLFVYSSIIREDMRETANKEQRVRCLFNISSEALIIHKNGVIVDVNKTFEDLFGVRNDSILYPVPSRIHNFLPDFDTVSEQYHNNNGNNDSNGSDSNSVDSTDMMETIAVNSNGQQFAVEVKIERASLQLDDNDLVEIVSIVDTSAKRRLMKAEAINDAKINFLTTVCHEVRTPINGILASVDIVERTILNYTQREFLYCIKDSANYLLDLITAILDFSKIEAGKMELQKIEFNMITMLEETMNIVYQTAQERELEMLLIVEEDVPIIVVGDPYRVKQILLNFISNAIKCTPKGQVIVRVKLVRKEATGEPAMCINTISFEVEDSGIGIKEEHLNSLFTAFLQLDGTLPSRNVQGTGLGLCISKRLCNMMGGDIGVRSKYGSGSTFSFTSLLQSDNKTTFASVSNSLSLYNANHIMIHTNNEQFVCTPIKGFVYDKNQFICESAIKYFKMLKIELQPLAREEDLLGLLQGGGTITRCTGGQQIFIILCNEPSNIEEIKLAMKFVNDNCLVYWLLISDSRQPNVDPFFSGTLKKPIQLPGVVECLYGLQRVPIPQDMHFLLTNNRTSRPSQYRSNSSDGCSFDRHKDLNHNRSSSYSDHVAITRGLVQNNRSPRTTIENEEDQPKINTASSSIPIVEKTPNNNMPPLPVRPNFDTMMTNSSSSIGSTSSSSILIEPPTSSTQRMHPLLPHRLPLHQHQQPLFDQMSINNITNSPLNADHFKMHYSSSPGLLSSSFDSPSCTPPMFNKSQIHSGYSQSMIEPISLRISQNLANELAKVSPKILSIKSPSLSPTFEATSPPPRRMSVPTLDLDSQMDEFSRKSRSTIDRGFVDMADSTQLSKSSFRILLVEDNLVNVKVFSRILKDGGYNIDIAWNGVQGVEAFSKCYYPIIFMDCSMPDMDGYQATEIIRKREREILSVDKRYKRSFVIALTANVTPSDREKCFDVGMDDFIQKPIRSSTVILSIVDKYLKHFTEDDFYYLSNRGQS
ncbi:hypothetical protein SAMD00019534_034990 [Acytostelium subglobosum LB1]|uniref:hypothetical protein n=1 Tax=Acytostelium subglobosum LB1 TaxID=1410327 RepID=UPI000644CDFB|nr:hypothetical protein SAMD00019534_034990 [Acytostelium subglobosum LB1]GAM20324.1 hypothetical protein SAMD00019534_034990 [Acytostelium subglobosum LB1]|eukprot:XP_012759845.1 hypothetical protein SAMD00019534_034990 [Acytostelium subglobosum LB1]